MTKKLFFVLLLAIQAAAANGERFVLRKIRGLIGLYFYLLR